MDFPDKSQPASQPKAPVEPIVTGAKKVQRPATRRFLDFMFAESPKEASKRIGREIIAPTIKRGVEEALNNFISGMMWGDSANRPISTVAKGMIMRGGTNYNAISSSNSMALARQASPPSSGNYQDLAFEDIQFAEILLAGLFERLNDYRVVTVADLYELANISTSPSDERFGWISLDGARISKRREGYLLELPRPTLI